MTKYGETLQERIVYILVCDFATRPELDLIQKNNPEKLEALTSPEVIDLLENTKYDMRSSICFEALSQLYDSDTTEGKKKFQALTSPVALAFFKSLPSLDINETGAFDLQKIEALISNPCLEFLRSVENISFEALSQFYDQDVSPDKEVFQTILNVGGFRFRSSFFREEEKIFRKLLQFNTPKVQALVSKEGLKFCTRTEISFDEFAQLYDNDATKFKVIATKNACKLIKRLKDPEKDEPSLLIINALLQWDTPKLETIVSKPCLKYLKRVEKGTETKELFDILSKLYSLDRTSEKVMFNAILSSDGASLLKAFKGKEKQLLETLQSCTPEKIKALTSWCCLDMLNTQNPYFKSLKDLSSFYNKDKSPEKENFKIIATSAFCKVMQQFPHISPEEFLKLDVHQLRLLPAALEHFVAKQTKPLKPFFNFRLEHVISLIDEETKDILNHHKLGTITTTFGIEIESCTLGNPPESIPNWQHKRDGSIHPEFGHQGMEYISPILRNEDSNVTSILEMCSLLQMHGAYANKSCGLHIHAGMLENELIGDAPSVQRLSRQNSAYEYSDLSQSTLRNEFILIKQIFINYIALEKEGLDFPKRNYDMENLNNRLGLDSNPKQIDKLIETKDLASLMNLTQDKRNTAKLNLHSLFKYGTIEFRAHSGTIDPTDMLSWMGFLNGLIDISKTMSQAPEGPHVPNTEEMKKLSNMLLEFKQNNSCVIDSLVTKKEVTSTEQSFAVRIGRSNTQATIQI